jgi:hypothetical protein
MSVRFAALTGTDRKVYTNVEPASRSVEGVITSSAAAVRGPVVLDSCK